ncbi:MAG: hypothetical protein SOI26_05555 [Coriobacteriales bacterium]|jgi:hypothetical protein
MPVSEAQKRALNKYRKEKTKQLSMRFFPSEADLWEWLDSQPSKSVYVKGLIRADMEAHRQ